MFTDLIKPSCFSPKIPNNKRIDFVRLTCRQSTSVGMKGVGVTTFYTGI
jgi:hypothetical protein